MPLYFFLLIYEKWEDVPNPNSIHLRRMGAIYQCISFSESPQQLCGIYRDDAIRVRGKTQAVMGPVSFLIFFV